MQLALSPQDLLQHHSGLHSVAGSQRWVTLIWPPKVGSPGKTEPGIVFLQLTFPSPHLCKASVEGTPEKEDTQLQPGLEHTSWQTRNKGEPTLG